VKSVFGKRDPSADGQPEGAVASGRAVGPVERLVQLLPSTDGLLARAAYLELVLFQELSSVVGDASHLGDKQVLGQVASAALERHERAVAALTRRGVDVSLTMRGVAADVDEYAVRVRGRDAYERILTVYLVAGFFHEFFAHVGEASEGAGAEALAVVVEGAGEQDARLLEILQRAMESDGLLSPRLAMWGRRIIGDSVLALRKTLGMTPGTPVEELPEGAFDVISKESSELLAGHSRRMNSLGLAA